MEFMVNCPNDGDVEVSLDDVSTVVLRESDHVEIVFECPICGERIRASARIPNVLLAAIEALEVDTDDPEVTLAGLVALAESIDDTPDDRVDSTDSRIEAYCEYFRRELSTVTCVEDALAEIDPGPKR